MEESKSIIKHLRMHCPNVKIIARGHDLNVSKSLIEVGADMAVATDVEASLELAKQTLAFSGFEKNKQTAIIHSFRHYFNAKIRRKKSRI